MSSDVPKSWSPLNLSDVVKFSGGSAFKEIYQGEQSGKYPFIKVSDMNLTGNHRHIVRSNNWISEEVQKLAKIKLFPAQTTVFAKVGAALSLNRRRLLTRKTAIDNNMMAAIPTNCEPEFFYQFMLSVDLRTIVQSGAVPSVNQSQMDVIPFNCPPLPEQKKIAAILTSVDDVIENTQAQIAKLQDLKKATMNELLTKGIGHTEFKDSEWGQIPKSWEEATLGSLGVFSKGKGIAKKDVVKTGLPCVRYAEIYTSYNYILNDFLSYISPETAKASKLLKKGDIIFAGSGETVEDIGKSVAFCGLEQAYVGGDAVIFSPTSNLDSRFMAYQLNDDFRRIQIRKLGQGSSVIHIYQSGLAEIRIVLPPLNEQIAVADIIAQIIENEKAKTLSLSKLKSLKKALMNDLLTGKVRVNVN